MVKSKFEWMNDPELRKVMKQQANHFGDDEGIPREDAFQEAYLWMAEHPDYHYLLPGQVAWRLRHHFEKLHRKREAERKAINATPAGAAPYRPIYSQKRRTSEDSYE